MMVLVTGATGYIGAHTCVELLAAGHDVVAVDNLANSKVQVLSRIRELTGRDVRFYEADILDGGQVDRIFGENAIDAVVHFAALKSVPESVAEPLRYYHNNVTGTLNLCARMARHGVRRIVFSSSATVYGASVTMPLTEDAPLAPVNPYGRTKEMIERILRDVYESDNAWSVALLRYFNPVGAHPSGRIGEDPNGVPGNLMPYITQVAVGKRQELVVFGDDFETDDGTGVRDYIHVVDLATGHLKALDRIAAGPGIHTYNLGTGTGYSVLEMVRAFERASGVSIPYRIGGRRPGDAAVSYCDPTKARTELAWTATRGIDEMCLDSWRWQSQNPRGYEAG